MENDMSTRQIFLSIFALTTMLFFMVCSKNDNRENSVIAKTGFATGPEIGEHAPNFSLPDQYGKTSTLQELVGENGALINFYRSASW